MDFWPKRWGGRNFDGDKGLGTVQTLGLPFSKQVNGNTTARKIGEFSETVIEEVEPGFFITGDVKRDGVTRLETWQSEAYDQTFTRFNGLILRHLGGNEFGNTSFVSDGTIPVSTYPTVAGFTFQTVSLGRQITALFSKGRYTNNGVAYTFNAPDCGPMAGNDEDDERGVYVRIPFVSSTTAYGAGPARVTIITQERDSATDHWSRKILSLRLIRLTRETATDALMPRLPGTEKCPLHINGIYPFGADKFVVLACAMFSPHPYNVGYQGGDLLIYKTSDGGNTFSAATVAAVKANLPSAPALRNPADTPENYLRWPRDYDCKLNLALQNVSVTASLLVVTPLIYVLSLVNYKNDAGTWRNTPEMYRTTDGGSSFSQIAFPALLENHTPPQPVKIESMVDLGMGRLLAKTRSGPFGDDNLWNLIRSEDFGATWTCIPKVGLPADTAPTSFFTGHFKVLARRTATKAGRVVLPVWGGSSYDLYESRTDGLSWRKVARLAPSEECFRMETDLQDEVSDRNFMQLVYLGAEGEEVPLDITSPWRYDRRKTYEDML